MSRTWISGWVIGSLAVSPMLGWAAEHGGQEHGGKTSAPAATTAGSTTEEQHARQTVHVPPSAEQIRQAIRTHVTQTAQGQGAFTIQDPITHTTRTLTLVRVHERVGKTGAFYYSCTDMNDVASGETLDLDFDVDAKDGQLDVVDVRIHKVNGQPRYTYDDKDNRIPLM